MNGKIAIVTGANRGIGRETALGLAKEDHSPGDFRRGREYERRLFSQNAAKENPQDLQRSKTARRAVGVQQFTVEKSDYKGYCFLRHGCEEIRQLESKIEFMDRLLEDKTKQ